VTPDWTIRAGDCRELIRSIPAASVQTCITSPPYWGLRDYGTATWEGGDSNCDHIKHSIPRDLDERGSSTLGGTTKTQNAAELAGNYLHECGMCGAIRNDLQVGLEQTPEDYVSEMVDVFREVRRVLRDDGTLWLNLGDSYASNPTIGLKQKDLVGIPWRVAFALQADGWYLRSDIIWAKPNPMPESITDRPTKAHEYLFLFTKSARYYYDADAIKEPLATEPHAPGNKKLDASRNDHDQMNKVWGSDGLRNKRSVWTIATQPYSGAHFAVMPEALVEPCVNAGTSERGCCASCGDPFARVVERTGGPPSGDHRKRADGITGGKTAHDTGTVAGSHLSNIYKEYGYPEIKTIGWKPGCGCDQSDPVACVVLDPFAGAGTVPLVAARLGRDSIGLELNPEYAELARERIRAWELTDEARQFPLFEEATA